MQYFRGGGLPVFLLFLAAHSGCGGGGANLPELGEVTGVVTLDDKPVEGLTVTFDPQDTRPSTGVTDAEGRYSLYFNADNSGAAVVEHTVRIAQTPDAERPVENDVHIPAVYNVESKLKAQVKPGENMFDFALKSKP